jgi:hypothetical protein
MQRLRDDCRTLAGEQRENGIGVFRLVERTVADPERLLCLNEVVAQSVFRDGEQGRAGIARAARPGASIPVSGSLAVTEPATLQSVSDDDRYCRRPGASMAGSDRGPRRDLVAGPCDGPGDDPAPAGAVEPALARRARKDRALRTRPRCPRKPVGRLKSSTSSRSTARVSREAGSRSTKSTRVPIRGGWWIGIPKERRERLPSPDEARPGSARTRRLVDQLRPRRDPRPLQPRRDRLRRFRTGRTPGLIAGSPAKLSFPKLADSSIKTKSEQEGERKEAERELDLRRIRRRRPCAPTGLRGLDCESHDRHPRHFVCHSFVVL